ncbi:ATP-binding cassette domain-containing protein [Microbispora sp. RL4-1S]|uniref:ATP-binding cassette domain-containing protein n=1 Tax=Microbispora oryzae TaxID=2806554 RepID=A0A940WS33_9ACTN|nr:ATP-binding cassette domain-containing protein [Microbispora oryzae]MBP2708348.1 ATP-binding cassette domain-containing protein [Microbispora oryzae]
MSAGTVVRFDGLTKRFGPMTAVEDVSFEVRSGRIVGLLGRNGAGKTTTLRMLLGLTRPTAGHATLFGHAYSDLPDAARRIGVSIDGIGPLTAVTGRRDLRVWASQMGVPATRVEEVLDRVGLADSANKQIKNYSQGMRQRHALATALLADPELIVLDEPANGLDPDGIRWLRTFLRSLADEGRTILLSSHLLAEVEQTVDDVVILQQTLRYCGPLDELTEDGQVSLEARFFQLVDTPAREQAHA